MDKRTVLLIVINLLLLLLFVYRIRRKKKLPNIIVLIAATFIFLSVIELGYRFFFRDISFETGSCSQDFFKPDSTLGYTMHQTGPCTVAKMARKGDTIYRATYTIVPGTDSMGRGINRRIGYVPAGTGKELVFLGCSFTFGQGLDDTATLPYQVGKMTNLSAANLGVTGYGIHQVYQLFNEQYASNANSGRVFIYSFLYDHILRANGLYAWNLQGPLFKKEGDSLINTGPMSNTLDAAEPGYIRYVSLLGSFSFLKDMLGRIALNNRVKKLQPADYDKCFLMIRKMAQAIQRTGGRLIVLNWDNANWANLEIKGLPVAMIEQELKAMADVGVEVVNVSSLLDYTDRNNFIPRDGHPSAVANARMARALKSTFMSPGATR